MFIHRLLDYPWIYNTFRGSHHGKIEDVIKKEILISDGDWILDFGCGPATNSSILRNSFYVGVDKNAGYIKYAKAKFPREKFILADICRSFGLNAKFNWILGNCVFHGLSDEEAASALQGIKPLLKNNGRLLIVDLLNPGNDNYLGKFMVSLDRGRYPRSQIQYKDLFIQEFDIIKEYAIKIYCWDFCIFLMSL